MLDDLLNDRQAGDNGLALLDARDTLIDVLLCDVQRLQLEHGPEFLLRDIDNLGRVLLSIINDEAPEERDGFALDGALLDVELREAVDQLQVLFNHVFWLNLLNSLNDVLKVLIGEVCRDVGQEFVDRELLVEDARERPAPNRLQILHSNQLLLQHELQELKGLLDELDVPF